MKKNRIKIKINDCVVNFISEFVLFLDKYRNFLSFENIDTLNDYKSML